MFNFYKFIIDKTQTAENQIVNYIIIPYKNQITDVILLLFPIF